MTEKLRAVDSTIEALTLQHTEFTFGDVQPTTVLGCVVDLQTLGQLASHVWCKRFVERTGRVGVEVVHHQNDLLRFGVELVQEITQRVRPIDLRATLRDSNVSVTPQRLAKHE